MEKINSFCPPGMRPEPEREGLPLAMAYVPVQAWRDIYEDGKALMRGTVFAQLDLPFGGKTR